MSWLALISTELLKLKRSRVLMIALIAPVLQVAAIYLMTLPFRGGSTPLPYGLFVLMTLQIWAFFMLPLSVTLLSVLSANIEHGARAWNYVLATPVARWRIFAVKVALVFFLTALMSAAVWLLLPLAGAIRDLKAPGMGGSYDWTGAGEMILRIYAGAVLMTAIQLWFALRFRNIVISMGVGVAGGFIAVVSMIGGMIIGPTEANYFRFFPWLIPLETIQPDKIVRDTVWVGLFGGLLAIAALVAHLSRREA